MMKELLSSPGYIGMLTLTYMIYHLYIYISVNSKNINNDRLKYSYLFKIFIFTNYNGSKYPYLFYFKFKLFLIFVFLIYMIFINFLIIRILQRHKQSFCKSKIINFQIIMTINSSCHEFYINIFIRVTTIFIYELILLF